MAQQRPESLLRYPTTRGAPALTQALQRHLAACGIAAAEENVLVVGLAVLHLSVLVDDLGLRAGTVLYAFAAGALAVSAMVLPGISGSSLLMSCGLYLPVIAAMKELLHFQFGQFWLLAAVGAGVLAGFAVAPHLIRGWMRRAPSAVTYAVLGMMLGSLYAIVVGPTTLKVPQPAMTLPDFHPLWFVLGIVAMLMLDALKRHAEKAKVGGGKSAGNA